MLLFKRLSEDTPLFIAKGVPPALLLSYLHLVAEPAALKDSI